MAKPYSHSKTAPPVVSDAHSDTEYLRERYCAESPPQYPPLRAGFTFLKVLYGACWSAAYALYVLQARKDKTMGMPLLAVMLNITWEIVFTFVHKQSGLKQQIHLVWFLLDSLVVVEAMRFGPNAWAGTSPIIEAHFAPVFCVGILLALSAQWTFANQFAHRNARFWTAYFCQYIISWGSLWMLVVAGHAGGHSVAIWLFRFIGTFAVNLRHLYRANAWPDKYRFLAGPFAMWILWMPCIADLMYPFVYMFIVHSAHDLTHHDTG